jgi:predicted AlkP superfamily phosphohydrolase/phosphomutase
MKRRVFLLGLDGGSWNVLDRLMAVGKMPHLSRICQEGVRATLTSTIPAITPVAWSSLMTGTNPGKHGVFGFFKSSAESSYLQVPVNRLDMLVPTIFDYYQEGGRLISLNLPMSYPATPINGLMVSGMMTPLAHTVRSQHPATLLDRLAKAGITYTIDPKSLIGKDVHPQNMMQQWQRAGGRFAAQLREITQQRMRAAHMLMSEEEWEVFICVIVGTDRLQHVFWDRLMAGEPDAIEPSLVSYYEQVDQEIEALTSRLAADDVLLVVSDHGFADCRGVFYTNAWLASQGWLAAAPRQQGLQLGLKRILKRCGINRASLRRWIGERRLGRLQLVLGDVDWMRTRAFLRSPFGIRLNLQGREPQGTLTESQRGDIQAELVAALLNLEDAEGRCPIANVFRAPDIYQGPAAGQAPDLVFTFHEDANYSAYAADLGKGVFAATPFKTGEHRISGIFVAWGGGIQHRAEASCFAIQDILPTVLHLGGRAVPEICDGRVLTEIMTAPGEIRYDADWQRFLPQRSQLAYDAAQEAEIRDRLQALGYISKDR